MRLNIPGSRRRALPWLVAVLALVALSTTSCASAQELGIDWRGLAVQVINFLLLLSVLYFFAYRIIQRKLDERSQRIKDSMERARDVEEQATHAQQEVARVVAEARQDGQSIISQATQIGERLKEEARQEARQEATTIAARERDRLERERQEMLADLRREFADVAIAAAEKVIHQALDKKAHQRLIEDVLEESAQLKQP